MVPNVGENIYGTRMKTQQYMCGGVWVYIKDGVTAYMNLATDDMLYMSRSEGPLNQLLNRFGDFFSFKVKKRNRSPIFKLQNNSV